MTSKSSRAKASCATSAPQIIDDALKRYRQDLTTSCASSKAMAFQRIEKLPAEEGKTSAARARSKGTVITKDYLESLREVPWFEIRLADDERPAQMESLKDSIELKRSSRQAFEDKKRSWSRVTNCRGPC